MLTNYTAYPNSICREAQIRTGIVAVSGRKPNLLADLPINKLFNYHLTQFFQVKAYGKFVLVCALDSKLPTRERGIKFPE